MKGWHLLSQAEGQPEKRNGRGRAEYPKGGLRSKMVRMGMFGVSEGFSEGFGVKIRLLIS